MRVRLSKIEVRCASACETIKKVRLCVRHTVKVLATQRLLLIACLQYIMWNQLKSLVIYILSARNFHNCNYFNHYKSDWSELKWSLENAQPVNLSLCVCDKFLALICYLGREIGPFPISHRFRPGPRIICQTSPPITKIKFGHPNLWMQNYL